MCVLASQRLHRAGKIKSLYAELDWTQRLSAMRKDFPDAPVVLIKGGVLPAALQRLFADERMLDAAQQLGVGADVALNPAWNLRGKMPKHVRTLPEQGRGLTQRVQGPVRYPVRYPVHHLGHARARDAQEETVVPWHQDNRSAP